MSSYFSNSPMMRRYCSQTTTTINRPAGDCNVDDWVDCCDAGAFSATSSSSSFSQRLGWSQRHSRPPSQSTYLHSFTAPPNISAYRHANSMFADPPVTSSTSCTLSHVVPYEARLSHHPHDTGTSSSVYHQQMYSDKSLVAAMNGHYKLERPSPPATPSSEPRQTDVTDTWNISDQYINDNEPDIASQQTDVGQKDDDLSALDEHQSDEDSDDTVTGSVVTQSASPQQQQQTSDNRHTQRAVVHPIYPWMTRVHSKHGKSCMLARVDSNH